MWASAQQSDQKLTPAVPALSGAMDKLEDIETLQKFASVHSSAHNYFILDRHNNRRETVKQHRPTALTEARSLAA